VHHESRFLIHNVPASCAALNSGWAKSSWLYHALAVVAGVMLALAFPKPNIAGFAWVAPGLLLFAARGGKAFRLGYLAGFTHYLVSLSWLLQIPVRFYPILGWVALAAYLALYPAAWSWMVSGFGFRVSGWRGRTAFALLAAVGWVAMEMAIARMLSGFPWNLLGASQQRLLPLIQIASFTGVYGVSFLVVWFSVSLSNAMSALFTRPSERNVVLKELALPILVVAAVYAFGFHQIKSAPEVTRTLRIALVQPSIPQTMIWNAADSDTRFAELMALTQAALTNKPDLLIWPEAAVPKMVRADPDTERAITRLAASNHVWLIIGSDDFDFRGTNAIFFNNSFLVSPRGELANNYRKRRLVIFGEYVPLVERLPFVKYLTPISGGFTAGERPVTFDLGELGAKTSVLICFEDVFPHYAREHAGENVDFLVNITNDGWFGESAAQWQQATSAAFRAVENGKPLVRCANNGLSCWIDRFGGLNDVYFESSTDIYRAGFKIITVPIPAPEVRPSRTFYNKHGDVFGWCCASVTVAVLAARLVRNRRRNLP
jgi:apolipoprotein N-acyltransferase